MSTTDLAAAIDPAAYEIDDVSAIFSPGLIVFRDLVQANLDELIRLAGSPQRLRPHVKTHKMPGVVGMELDLGITRHKCATIAEAEMLCQAGVGDIFVAYQLVGPNLGRLASLMDKYADVKFATLVDDPQPLAALADVMTRRNKSIEVLMDLDPGMHRTGIDPAHDAVELYEMISTTPGVRPGGLHWYDGHLRQRELAERREAVDVGWERCLKLRDTLLMSGLAIPRIVAAGTGSFPILAEKEEPGLELSPGTVVLYDAGYKNDFPDLNFVPAVGVLTRVVSRRRAGHLTLDLGHKSISPDQPAGHRVFFPTLPDAVEVNHTEEHLVIETDRAADFAVGDPLVALPRHVCPTCALHDSAYVVTGRRVTDRWPVVARSRQLTA